MEPHINRVTLDLGASGYTSWFDIKKTTSFTFQVVVPNGPIGTFALESTADDQTVQDEIAKSVAAPGAAPATDLTTKTSISAGGGTATGTAKNFMISLTLPQNGSHVRLKYTSTSGSGSSTVFFIARG